MIQLFCLDGRPHCWHHSELQHSLSVHLGIHLDETCCWCGAQGCRDVAGVERAPEAHGEFLPSPEVEASSRRRVRRAIRYYRKRSSGKPVTQLTRRQAEYLKAASEGMTGREIMELFGWTSEGNERHLRKDILSRLNAKNIFHAVAISIRNGYI